MILSMYTDVIVNQLRTNIKTNLNKYDNEQKFVKDFIENYDASLYSLDIEVQFPTLDTTISNKEDKRKQWEIDCQNAILLHKEFVQKYNIPLSILSDERFIIYLTHDIYYEYMLKRWPTGGKEPRLKEKYFLPSGNQAFTRNMFLRFFWYAHITYDASAQDPYHLTKVAFEYADPVNQIMERKYSKNDKIVKAALKAIEGSENSKILNTKRTLYGKAINNILGMYCLDGLNEKDLIDVFKQEITKITGTTVTDNEEIPEE